MFIGLDKIELLDGLIVFNIWFFLLSLLIVAEFFCSWYASYRKTGWKLNIWHLNLFLGYILPCVIMYPFASSEMNFITAGTAYIRFSPYVEEAFFISFVGYLSVLLGKEIYVHLRHECGHFNLFSKIILTNIQYTTALYLWCVLCVMFLVSAFFLGLQEGLLFNARGWFFTNPAYRPIGNFMTGIYALAFSYIGMRLLSGIGGKWDKYLLLTLFLLSISWGSRGLTFSTLVGLFFYWYYLNPSFSFKKIFGVGALILFSVMLLGVFRGQNGIQENVVNSIFTAGMQIFYGNTFSDGRDFAWMLSGFDGTYQMGKTYISGVFSFLPSELFPWRREFAIGPYTLELAGVLNENGEHPGLRGGLFFEMFFNFSYIGVIALGSLWGYFLARADQGMRYHVENGRSIINGYIAGLPIFFLGVLMVSAGSFAMYVFFTFHLISIFINSILHRRS